MVNTNILSMFILLVMWFNISLCKDSKYEMLINYKNQRINLKKKILPKFVFAIIQYLQ
jgi:hypothetical protein